MSQAPEKAFHVSWDQFHRDARVLAWRLADTIAAKRVDAIVTITRGGLVPAAIVARELGIRVIETISIASYDHQNQRGLEVLKDIGDTILSPRALDAPGAAADDDRACGARVLVVDDLTDTGRTAKVVRERLPAAHFAAVYAKPAGAPLVDTFVTEVSQDTWIYFPWDLALAYQPPLQGKD